MNSRWWHLRHFVFAVASLAAGIVSLVTGDTVWGVIFLWLGVWWILIGIHDRRGRLVQRS